MGLEAEIFAWRLGFGPGGWGLGLEAGFWAWRLGFGPGGWDLGLVAGIWASRLVLSSKKKVPTLKEASSLEDRCS